MRWVWVAGSAAAACAVVAVALFLGDLETLSWIAGAGSFIIAVPSLVVALTHGTLDQRARTPDPAPAADPSPVRPQAPSPMGEESRVAVELTTPRIRIARRLASVLNGAAIGAGVMVLGIGLDSLTGGVEPDRFTWERLFQLYSFIGGVCALSLWLNQAEGKDLLIVDDTGLTIVDKRWIRARDASFSIAWTLVRRIHLAAEPGGAFHTLVVEFVSAEDGTAERAQIKALEKRSTYVSYNSRAVARLYLASGGMERTALLSQTRTALARFGGDAYGE